jgi:hypothetical protein
MSDLQVTIEYICPPIPIRVFDYRAYLTDDDDGPEGWGGTPANALLALAIDMGADND